MRLPAILAATLLLCAAVPAQEPVAPPNWKWVTDEPAELVPGPELPPGTWFFVEMPPGFHITTGPGATLYEPEHQASGRFTLAAHVFIFPDAGDGGYGLFVGGRDLESAAPSRLEFLLRRDGTAAVFKRDAGEMTTLIEWAAHAAVAQPAAEDTGANDIVIEAGTTEVVFKVNGEVVGSVARSEVDVDGQFGFRLDGPTNIHVSSLDVTAHLAPARR